MSDLISRQEALIAIMDLYPGMPRVPWLRKRWARRYEPYIDAEKAIRKLPSAEPERKTGKWIERNPQNSDKCRLIECDQCGFSHIVGFNVPYEHWIENRNFCERCGAKMEGNA